MHGRKVAVNTFKLGVFARQLEFCLVVIKIPVFPIAGVMARVATASLSTFVHVVFLVTRIAIGLGFLEHHGQMTFLTLCHHVFAGQREARNAVIEFHFFPGILMVAGAAFLAFFAFVLVVFFMAREAVCFQLVLVQISFVATHAFSRAMLAQQWIFRLFVVIKGNLFPATVNVAVFTLGTKATFVLVVFLMAREAIHFEFVFVQVSLVAIIALHVLVLARQREFGFFVVIKGDIFPAALDVARFAFWPEFTFVLVIFLVTRVAICF